MGRFNNTIENNQLTTKICSTCYKEKIISEFNKRNDRSKDGFRNSCKLCKKQYNKQYLQNHKEEIKQKNKRKYIEHREEILQYQKQYRIKHKKNLIKKRKQHRLENPIAEKICSECKIKKPISEFVKRKNIGNGYRNCCKKCKNQYKKQYYLKNLNKHKKYIKKWHLKNKNYFEQYRLKHKNELKEKQANPTNKAKRNQQRNQRRKNDPYYRMLEIIRSRTRNALKSQDVKKTLKTLDGLGCTILFFKNYINNLLKTGMTMKNNGIKKWVLHHIKYCSSFNLLDMEQQKKCFHYSNLTPMWEDEHKELHKNNPY